MMSRTYSTNLKETVKPDQPQGAVGDPDLLAMRILDVDAWARILGHMACSGNAIEDEEVGVVAMALHTLAGLVHDDLKAFAAKHGAKL